MSADLCRIFKRRGQLRQRDIRILVDQFLKERSMRSQFALTFGAALRGNFNVTLLPDLAGPTHTSRR